MTIKEQRTVELALKCYFGPVGPMLWSYLNLALDRYLMDEEKYFIRTTYLGHRQ